MSMSICLCGPMSVSVCGPCLCGPMSDVRFNLWPPVFVTRCPFQSVAPCLCGPLFYIHPLTLPLPIINIISQHGNKLQVKNLNDKNVRISCLFQRQHCHVPILREFCDLLIHLCDLSRHLCDLWHHLGELSRHLLWTSESL